MAGRCKEEDTDRKFSVHLFLVLSWISKFVIKIINHKAYAQTELGHGSNLRELETTATFIEGQDCFEINSPFKTSSVKFWPGGLAKTCNCCVLMCQLIIKGKKCGVFPFFVQLRDLQTHQLLEGIETGTIGPKVNFSSFFPNFQIPFIFESSVGTLST